MRRSLKITIIAVILLGALIAGYLFFIPGSRVVFSMIVFKQDVTYMEAKAIAESYGLNIELFETNSEKNYDTYPALVITIKSREAGLLKGALLNNPKIENVWIQDKFTPI